MAFKHSISFATDLAANFGCNRFRITPDIVSKLLRPAIWSSCAVWLESEQTPFPWTGSLLSCCFAQDSIRNLWFCSYIIFLLRDQWMIARLSEAAMGVALVGNNFWLIPWEFHFPTKKNSVVTAWYLQSIKTFLTVELSQYRKSGSTFSSSEPVAASSDCSRLGNTLFVFASLTRPSCAGVLFQELGHWFCSQLLWLSSWIAFGNDYQMTGTGQ